MCIRDSQKLCVLHQKGKQAVGVIAADGAQDTVDGRVEKSCLQVFGPKLRVKAQRLEAFLGIRHENGFKAKLSEPLCAKPDQVAAKRLAQHPAGKAHHRHTVAAAQRTRFYHCSISPF